MACIRLRLGSVRRTDGNTCKMRHQGDRFHRGNGGTDHRDAGLLLALLLQGAAERTGQRGSAGGQTQHPHNSILLMDSVRRKTVKKIRRRTGRHRNRNAADAGVRTGFCVWHRSETLCKVCDLKAKYRTQETEIFHSCQISV